MQTRCWCSGGGALFALSLAVAPSAWADIASGQYDVTVTGNSVYICSPPYNCEPSTALLRQDVATGTVVRLSGFCGTPDSGTLGHEPCYEDECVPTGNYRYGFTAPQCGCGGNAPYWGAATVTSPLSPSCTRSSGDNAPVGEDGGAPWPADGQQFDSCSGTGGPGAQGPSCGCSSPASVFGVDVALFLFSLVLLGRRRVRR
jgi:hypothetical protein